MKLPCGDIAVVGRVEQIPRQRLAREMERAGTSLVRRFTVRCAALAVAHGAIAALRSGTIVELLDQADVAGIPVVSENALLRRLQLLPDLAAENRTLSHTDIAERSQLDPVVLRLLCLFDVIEPDAAPSFGFRDLVVARNVAALLRAGATPADVIAAAMTAKQAMAPGAHLAETRLSSDADGAIGLLIDNSPADLDGQHRLPLGLGRQHFEDEFENAEIAEEAEDYHAAERGYRRCLQLRRDDPICQFNLANVLCELGERKEARLLLQRAVRARPAFAEAWYNLAHLSGPLEAVDCLEQAIRADPHYADAIFNLARIETEAGRDAVAIGWWARYLALDPASAWSDRARRWLALCRMRLSGAGIGGSPNS